MLDDAISMGDSIEARAVFLNCRINRKDSGGLLFQDCECRVFRIGIPSLAKTEKHWAYRPLLVTDNKGEAGRRLPVAIDDNNARTVQHSFRMKAKQKCGSEGCNGAKNLTANHGLTQ